MEAQGEPATSSASSPTERSAGGEEAVPCLLCQACDSVIARQVRLACMVSPCMTAARGPPQCGARPCGARSRGPLQWGDPAVAPPLPRPRVSDASGARGITLPAG